MSTCKFVFITGTDTNVGKTVIAAALYEGLHQLGIAAHYWKPVQTGSPEDCDTQYLRMRVSQPKHILPPLFTYSAPRSPDQASHLEQRPAPTLEDISLATASVTSAYCLVEGAGGIFVPLNEHHERWIDLVEQKNWPVVVVARTGLGTINHTSLTLEALYRAHIKVAAVVLSGTPDQHNERSLRQLYPQQKFLCFDQINLDRLKDHTPTCVSLAKEIHDSLATDQDRNPTLPLDRKHIWHPYTQHATAADCLEITSAKGVWLHTACGRKLFDATGSWWVNTVGHGRPEINRAISLQQSKLDHVMFAGFTHKPASLLASAICERSNQDFSRVFFSDNGSTAVEVALKIAYQSFVNKGIDTRRKFLALKRSYHGDTIGTMSVGGGDGFDQGYAPLLFQAHRWTPECSHRVDTAFEADSLPQIAEHLEDHHQEYAAFIVEPLLQGAGGMLMHHPEWLRAVCELVRSHHIPVIFDEVFTGIGRLGDWFAYQRLNRKPDVLCLAKGLTGGNLGLALTVTTETMYENFLYPERARALLHGHSFTANPIACSAALATLQIYEKEQLCKRALSIEHIFSQWIDQHSATLNLQAPRCRGAVLAFELPSTEKPGYFNNTASPFAQQALQRGVWVRPLGNTVYLTPPLSTTDDELNALLENIRKCL